MKFKTLLMNLQRRFVPLVKRRQKSKAKRLNCKAVKCVRRKHKVYRKYKDSSHPACKRACRQACKEVKQAKYNFEKNLLKILKQDAKSFYAYAKGMAKTGSNIGPLITEQKVVVDSAQAPDSDGRGRIILVESGIVLFDAICTLLWPAYRFVVYTGEICPVSEAG